MHSEKSIDVPRAFGYGASNICPPLPFFNALSLSLCVISLRLSLQLCTCSLFSLQVLREEPGLPLVFCPASQLRFGNVGLRFVFDHIPTLMSRLLFCFPLVCSGPPCLEYAWILDSVVGFPSTKDRLAPTKTHLTASPLSTATQSHSYYVPLLRKVSFPSVIVINV